jgi:hypothetical protein
MGRQTHADCLVRIQAQYGSSKGRFERPFSHSYGSRAGAQAQADLARQQSWRHPGWTSWQSVGRSAKVVTISIIAAARKKERPFFLALEQAFSTTYKMEFSQPVFLKVDDIPRKGIFSDCRRKVSYVQTCKQECL